MKYLFIELSANAVRFVDFTDNIKKEFEFLFKDKKDFRYKEQLDEFLIDSALKQKDFDECSVSWSGFRSTLIPQNIFSESTPEALFRLCFGLEVPSGDIDYNRIPEAGLINLFEIPLWVKSFFVIRYPRSIIHHEGSLILRNIFAEPGFKQKSVLLVYADSFLLVIIKENKLQFYSIFEYLETDDIVYHFMFTLQQREMLQDKGSIELYPGVGSKKEKVDELMIKLQSLQDLKKSTITIDHDIILKSHKLCV